MYLAQPVRTLNPIAATLERVGELRADTQGRLRRLPSHVKAEGVLAVVLQELRCHEPPNFKSRPRKKEPQASTNVTFGIHTANADAGR